MLEEGKVRDLLGAMGTPVVLQRSTPFLGAMPSAVGRYFSPNGDRVTRPARART